MKSGSALGFKMAVERRVKVVCVPWRQKHLRGSARFSRSRCWYGGALDWSSQHWRSISESFHTQRRLGLSKKYPCCVKALGFCYWQNLLLPGHCKPLYTRPREKTLKWPSCDPRSPWETRPWVESRTPPPDLVFLSLQQSVLLCFPTTVETPPPTMESGKARGWIMIQFCTQV